jgi:hypothetical protein
MDWNDLAQYKNKWMEGMDWKDLAQYKDKWMSLVNDVKNLKVL